VVPLASFYPTTRFTRTQRVNYALGWFLQDYRGMEVKMHTGSIDGMIAIVGLVPEQRLGVYVLANRDHAELRHALLYRVLDLYNGGPARDWSADLKVLYDGLAEQGRQAEARFGQGRKQGTRPSADLAEYAGTYTDSLYGELRVTVEGGRLRARFGKGFDGPLEHWHYDTFIATWDDRRSGRSPLTFTLDVAGRVTSVALQDAGVTFHRTR
jgi:hypothetical protein